MKKALLSLSLIASLLTAPTFAANTQCSGSIADHYFAPLNMLNLNDCDLRDSEMQDVVKFVAENPVDYLYLANSPVGNTAGFLLSKINKKLVVLDLSNTGLDDSGIRYLRNVEALIISDNAVTDVGLTTLLSNIPNLQALYIDNNPISTESIRTISIMPMLESLSVQNNRLNDDAVDMLSQTNIGFLMLSNNEITDKGASELAAMTGLKYLFLDANPITSEGVKAIAKNNSLEYLSLNADKLGDSIAAIAKMPALESLSLSNDNLVDKDLLIIPHSHVMSLSLENNWITDKGVEYLTNESSRNIYRIYLHGNSIGDKGAALLARLPHLDSLDLSYNAIGVKGAEALAKSVSKNLWLFLDDNFFGDDGAIALAKAENISNLSVSNCQIGDAGALAFAANQVGQNYSLDVSYNHITPNGLAALANNPRIYNLNTEGNDEQMLKNAKLREKKREKQVFMIHALEQSCAKHAGDACKKTLKMVEFLKHQKI